MLDRDAKIEAIRAALSDLVDMLADETVSRARARKAPPALEPEPAAKPMESDEEEGPEPLEDETCPFCKKPLSECTCEG